MVNLSDILHRVIHPACMDLGPKFSSPEASVMLLSIGLQESRFEYHQQVGGPAHGYWQFEKGGGVHGVLTNPSSVGRAHEVCARYGVAATSDAVYEALVTNDQLACAFARLLLYTDPKPLPGVTDVNGAWGYYVENWRPGKPHWPTWPGNHDQAVKTAAIG